MDADAPVIRLRGLFKRYADVEAVAGIDLEVRAGECFGLLGPNGAGKTTTVEILEGLLAPTAGEVTVLGRAWNGQAQQIRERIGVALQETQLADRQTVRETIRLFRSFYPHGREVEETLESVGLTEKADAWVSKLSGGQRQRLAVACALIGDPELLFLDEPTTGLDPQSRRSLWEVLGALRRRGRSVLLTTHYMDEAERLCDRVAVMDHGRIIALGTPRELIARLGSDEVVELTADGPVDEAFLAAVPGVRSVRRSLERWVLSVEALHRTLPELLERLRAAGVQPTGLETHRASLEDVFVSLTGRTLRDAA